MNLEKIKTLLIDISQFEIIKIIDNSSSHASHKGVQGLTNELTHIEIHIKNPNDLKRLDIHRQIVDASRLTASLLSFVRHLHASLRSIFLCSCFS